MRAWRSRGTKKRWLDVRGHDWFNDEPDLDITREEAADTSSMEHLCFFEKPALVRNESHIIMYS